MGRFVRGDVVVTPFPYSDLSTSKRRPALVVAPIDGDDVIVCQITSQSIVDRYAIRLADSDFHSGGLRRTSNVRPNRLFTADGKIVSYRAGMLTPEKMDEVIAKIVQIVKGEEETPRDQGAPQEE